MQEKKSDTCLSGIRLGYVERLHGLRGSVVVRLELAGPAGSLDKGTELQVAGKVLHVSRCSVRDTTSLLIRFTGYETREITEFLPGNDIYISRSELLNGNSGMIPLDLFVGLEIYNAGKSMLVEEYRAYKSNPVLVVSNDEKKFPVPLLMVLDAGIDWKAGRVEMILPEGLEDLEL